VFHQQLPVFNTAPAGKSGQLATAGLGCAVKSCTAGRGCVVKKRRLMKAKIIVMPKKTVLDPQGKTVKHALESMHFTGIKDVRIGKFMEIELEGGNKAELQKQIDFVQSLEVVRVDAERNLLLVKGAVPGAIGGDVIVKPAVKS
jgi:phosphoribosylformylglycinamidine synthase PurS subunit